MRIFVFGNINAGKSYKIRELKDIHFPEYPILSIDQYRIKYGDNTYEKEIVAQDKFVEDIYDLKDCIVECTGLGPLGKKLHDRQPFKNDIILFINTPIETCINRLKNKDFSLIPYPPVEENMEDTIIRCGKEFEEGDLKYLWMNKVLQIFEINQENDIKNLPIEILSKFSDVINLLYPLNSIRSLYSYGSLARNEMNLYSDIDCFVVTDLDIVDLFDLIKVNFLDLELDRIGNKITLRNERNILIELVVIKDLSDGERYIKGSLVRNLNAAAIKLDSLDKEYIDHLNIDYNKPIDSLGFLISELNFYVKSLPKLINQNNRYKYYFHFNIIVHNYIRINEIMKGNITYNYLPQVIYEEYKDLIEYNRDNLFEHYKYVIKKIDYLLKIISLYKI